MAALINEYNIDFLIWQRAEFSSETIDVRNQLGYISKEGIKMVNKYMKTCSIPLAIAEQHIKYEITLYSVRKAN